MFRKFISILRGAWLLRYPDLVRTLGDMRLAAFELNRIRQACPEAVIHPDVLIQGWRKDNLFLSAGVRIEKGTMLVFGDDLNGYGTLSVGENTWIGQYNNLRLSGHTSLTIGRDCLISQFCSLIAANHCLHSTTPMIYSPCDAKKINVTLGDDVWLGVGCTILPGVSIGTGAVIGANSVVTKSIPEYEIWAGNPARKIGQRE